MREVEAQPLGRDERTLLHRLRPQDLAQRGVQQVGPGVVAHDRRARAGVDGERDGIAFAERARDHPPLVHDQSAGRLLRVLDLDARAPRGRDGAAVADLAAALAVEGRDRRDHLDRTALFGPVDELAVDDQRLDARLGLQPVVADELAGDVGRDAAVDLADRRLAAALPGRPRALALRLHRAIEAGLVDGQRLRGQDVLRQIDGKSVGVVELEDHLARQLTPALRLELRGLALQQGEPLRQRLEEALLLAPDAVGDVGAAVDELGIGGAHLVDHGVGHTVHHRLVHSEQLRVTGCAAQDATQHVAAPFVGRQHAVADQEGERARVVRDHAERDVALSSPCPSGTPDSSCPRARMGTKRSVS